MNKIIMLGNGNGSTLELYNTCFVIQNGKDNFLIDTGGSIEIINRLNKVKIDYTKINNIFISHNHTDHLFGLLWMLKIIGWKILQGEIECNLNIYCNDVVFDSIKKLQKIAYH